MPTAERRTHFDTISEARAHMKELIDAAMEGTPASMRRETARAAVVDASRLRATLATLPSLRPEAVAEAGGWSLFINGT
ncbi:MAG: prevent-host-death protein, partial [Actinobacteria bacterium]|nr:prevent-host-death protein [Actinomycetota bacterium]